MPHITQFSAVELTTNKSFDHYVMPKVRTIRRVERLTGIAVHRPRYGSPIFRVHGRVKEAISITTAIEKFLKWLDDNKFEDVVLVAHSGDRYDFPLLVRACEDTGKFIDFKRKVVGLLDSWPLMKRKFPYRSSYSQANLCRTELGLSYDTHSALEDSQALAKLLIKADLNERDISSQIDKPSSYTKS